MVVAVAVFVDFVLVGVDEVGVGVGVEFEGDSFDREHLRDILFVRMGILTPEQTEYQVEA